MIATVEAEIRTERHFGLYVKCPGLLTDHIKVFSVLASAKSRLGVKFQENPSNGSRDYLLTYLLTPRSKILLGKLTGLHLVKKFPAFYGTRRFITALTSARHLSLS
jgi:hypothetical protein